MWFTHLFCPRVPHFPLSTCTGLLNTWSYGDHIKTRKVRILCPRKIFIPLSTQTPFYTFLPTMTTPSNASPTAVAHRDGVISAFNNYKYSRDRKDLSNMPFLLSLPAKYCLHVSFTSNLFLCFRGKLIFELENLINTKDPVLLTHQPMHNVLFLIRTEYNTLTKATPSMVTPLGYQAVTNFCSEVQVVRAASSTTPVPITAQDKALADIAEVMAEVKAKACSFHTHIFFLLY